MSGIAAGGGYELALACDEIVLVDDRSSAVSLPEVPLLGVLPGTGGLTRLVDKRKVRRDRADVFSTLGEGIKGKRALEWGLVDAVLPRSTFAAAVADRAAALAGTVPDKGERRGITLTPIEPQEDGATLRYRHVTLQLDAPARVAELTITAPAAPEPTNLSAIHERGDAFWPIAAFRELDDALMRLRFNHEEIGTVLVKTRGSMDNVLAVDRTLAEHRADWLVTEALHLVERTLKHLETSARSLFAVADEGSCFAGVLLELLLAADRSYMLDDHDAPVTLAVGPMNAGLLPMGNGLSRLESRFLGQPERVGIVLATQSPVGPKGALDLGLVTFAPDGLDWDDEVRLAVEERASLSPDALTGMEASLRFAGPETLETKIFGRLTAWQNWIFQRPNAVGDRGALKVYGRPEGVDFDWRRTG